MKRTLVFVIFTSILLSACSFTINPPRMVKGSGILSVETRPLSDFTAVELAGSGSVTVQLGDTHSIKIETDDNLLPQILTEVNEGKLVIRNRSNTMITTPLGIRITVTLKDISAVILSGAGDFILNGFKTDDLTLSLPGAGSIKAAGKVQTLSINLNGAGHIFCGDLAASSASVQINGSGNVQVSATNSLSAVVRGTGNILYRGTPARVEKDITGVGSITPIQ